MQAQIDDHSCCRADELPAVQHSTASVVSFAEKQQCLDCGDVRTIVIVLDPPTSAVVVMLLYLLPRCAEPFGRGVIQIREESGEVLFVLQKAGCETAHTIKQ